MKRIFFKPLDVLMFRSSRPFNREGARIAERGSITPIPFAGALKSAMLLQRHPSLPTDWHEKDEYKEAKEMVGMFGESGKVEIFGAFLARDDKDKPELFPIPMDLAKLDSNSLSVLSPLIDELVEYDGIYGLIGNKSFYSKPTGRGFVEVNTLLDYLGGSRLSYEAIVEEDDIFGYERRFGIMLKLKEKVTEEGMLYTADFLRLKEQYGFMVWVNDALDLPTSGYVKLGGEGRVARYEVISDRELHWERIIQGINREGRFKLYLATPAVFKKSNTNYWWCPNLDKLERVLQVKVKLVGASIGKPFYVGGWDLARGMQKPLSKAAREGAVYLFQIVEGKIDEEMKMPLQLSDLEPYSGLGCALIGRW